VRLACIRHVASVRPEPGSNSAYSVELAEAISHHVCTHVHHHDSVVQVRVWAISGDKKPGGGLSLLPGDVSGLLRRVSQIVSPATASVVRVCLQWSETVQHPDSIPRSARLCKSAAGAYLLGLVRHTLGDKKPGGGCTPPAWRRVRIARPFRLSLLDTSVVSSASRRSETSTQGRV
jgi:hypothetical protein